MRPYDFSDPKIIKCTQRTVNTKPDSVDLTAKLDGEKLAITTTLTQSDIKYIGSLVDLMLVNHGDVLEVMEQIALAPTKTEAIEILENFKKSIKTEMEK